MRGCCPWISLTVRELGSGMFSCWCCLCFWCGGCSFWRYGRPRWLQWWVGMGVIWRRGAEGLHCFQSDDWPRWLQRWVGMGVNNEFDISSPLYKGVPAILSLFHLLRSPNCDVVIMPRHWWRTPFDLAIGSIPKSQWSQVESCTSLLGSPYQFLRTNTIRRISRNILNYLINTQVDL